MPHQFTMSTLNLIRIKPPHRFVQQTTAEHLTVSTLDDYNEISHSCGTPSQQIKTCGIMY